MSSHPREIRWKKPAIDFFLDELEATDKDVDAVNALLEYVRDHAEDDDTRCPVDKDGHPELEQSDADIFVSYTEDWEVYYNWLPSQIVVLHVERVTASRIRVRV